MERPVAPQSADKLMKNGLSLFIHGFKHILGILLIQTFSIVVLFVLLFSITISFYDSHSSDTVQLKFLISLILSSLFIVTVQLGFIASFTAKFWAIIHNTHITTRLAFKVGIIKSLPLLGWLVIYIAVVATGLMLLFAPGLILMTSLFMGVALIIQNHLSPVEAIKISHRLVWPHLRRTMFYIFVSSCITLIVYLMTIYPLGLLITYLIADNPMLVGIIDIARYVLIVMLVPLFVALMIPYYMDLLLRSDNPPAQP